MEKEIARRIHQARKEEKQEETCADKECERCEAKNSLASPRKRRIPDGSDRSETNTRSTPPRRRVYFGSRGAFQSPPRPARTPTRRWQPPPPRREPNLPPWRMQSPPPQWSRPTTERFNQQLAWYTSMQQILEEEANLPPMPCNCVMCYGCIANMVRSMKPAWTFSDPTRLHDHFSQMQL